MSWLEIDQIILAMAIINAGSAIACLAFWLLPLVVAISITTLGGLFTIAYVLTK